MKGCHVVAHPLDDLFERRARREDGTDAALTKRFGVCLGVEEVDRMKEPDVQERGLFESERNVVDAQGAAAEVGALVRSDARARRRRSEA